MIIAPLVLTALSLLVLYFVVRKAVHHGILDADESRRAQATDASQADASEPPSGITAELS